MTHPRLAALTSVALFALASPAFAQAPAKPVEAPKPAAAPAAPAPTRPGLFWREGWKQNDAKGTEQPISAINVGNPDLEVKIYGPDPGLQGPKSDMKSFGGDTNENNPPHLFSGECKTACGFALRNKKAYADLSAPLSRIRLNTKMSGLHKVYPIIKLANGDWYVGDQPQGPSIRDYIVSEFSVADVHWIKIDPNTLLTKGNPVDKLDLTKVDEIGFMDPAPASGHGAGGWFDVGFVEVYSKSTPR